MPDAERAPSGKPTAMAKDDPNLDRVRELVLKLADVEETTIHGAPAWKLGGKLLACPAIHKSAEANSLLVKVGPKERAVLMATKPAAYYTTDHYRSDSVVLVRLSKIDRRSLQSLLKKAWRFLSEK
jgi:hypothetical protein